MNTCYGAGVEDHSEQIKCRLLRTGMLGVCTYLAFHKLLNAGTLSLAPDTMTRFLKLDSFLAPAAGKVVMVTLK